MSRLVRIAVVSWAALALSSGEPVQHSAAVKRILVLHWYGRDFPINGVFDAEFQAALQSSAPRGIEYYTEYLETNKFPGEKQAQLLCDYLRQKYADLKIDALVAEASPPLNFILDHRGELFPQVPLVFATERLNRANLMAGAGATGIVFANTYRETLDLALDLQPQTKQVFVISGSLDHDKSFEAIIRNALPNYGTKAAVNYLTDLTLDDLLLRVKGLPQRSIILYAWQQALDHQGRILESHEVFRLVAREAKVPIYTMSYVYVGLGSVGGRSWTREANAARLADLTLRVVNGTPAPGIPIENAPAIPMFDWRQLQRWGIREDRLPPGSVVRFRELTVWQQYRWRIVAVIAVIGLQASLIGALLVQRYRARRAHGELRVYKENLEQLVGQRTAELVEARDQALAANRTKSVFLATMSHELRTPLNAILGFSALVRADTSLPEQHRKDLAVVGSSGEHLLGLIDDVLDMAKIETGGAAAESAAIDLRNLVTDTVNMLRERALTKNLSLLLDVSSRAPRFVRTDPGKLRQVLTNLVGNALKYTDEGSVVVRVDARPEENPALLILIFDVEDTGIGIAREDQARIFDPFFQGAGARTRKGTGLGLSICRHFVELLGGTIQVESTPGRGSRFRIEVPAQIAEPSEVRAEPGVEEVIGLEPGQPDYRILIVEDQRENWLLLQRLLETVGFQVRVAEDGGQAVEAFSQWRPHFIWMDLRLPVMSGLEAAGRIRRLEGGTEVRIVAVTASVFASQREEVLAKGFDDFLRKPYRPREVFDCIARYLGVRYVYGARPSVESIGSPEILRPADLAALPAALRDELEKAVISLDTDRIAAAIRQVSAQDPSLGSVLARLNDGLAYTPILNALRSSRRSLAQAGA